ncbi:GHKL domain-containing protein [Enterococcus lactis]|uniref:GHKL domain-containing protein n=1 Tax=Enterococcus lactis TaxID=357441 RepID=UPI0022E601C5|nr:GHKL domain-containing protein [Enterococcus lactis]
MNILQLSYSLLISGQLMTMFVGLGYLNKKLRNKKYALLSILVILLISVLYQWINVIATGLVWLVMCALVIYHEETLQSALFYASLSIILLIFSNYLIYVILKSLSIMMHDLGICFLSIILYLCFAFYLRNHILKKVPLESMVYDISKYTVIATFLIYFIFLMIERFSDLDCFMKGAHGIFMLAYSLFAILISFLAVYTKKAEYKSKEEKNRMEYLIEYSEQIEKSYMEIRKFKHDYKNILVSMENYIQSNDIDGLKHFFYSHIKETGILFDQELLEMSPIRNLEAKEIKSIVLSKLYLAHEKGIEIDVNEPQKLDSFPVPSIMLVRMLGIILDNAVEESSIIDKPKILFAGLRQEEAITFIIANKCRSDIPDLHVLKKKSYSSKGKERGVGLSNLDELVQLNKNVYLDTKIEEGQFIQILTIWEG